MRDQLERAAQGDQDVGILVGIHEGRVIVGFQVRTDYIKLTQLQALELAEGVVDAVRQTDPQIHKLSRAVSMETETGIVPLETSQFTIVPMADGRVLIDFGKGNLLNNLKFSDDEAFTFAKALERACRQAREGIHVPTDSVLNPRRH